MLALELEHEGVVETMLAWGARDSGETIQHDPDFAPETLLMYYAAMGTRPALIRAMVRQGSDIKARDSNGSTALFYTDNLAKAAGIARLRRGDQCQEWEQ